MGGSLNAFEIAQKAQSLQVIIAGLSGQQPRVYTTLRSQPRAAKGTSSAPHIAPSVCGRGRAGPRRFTERGRRQLLSNGKAKVTPTNAPAQTKSVQL